VNLSKDIVRNEMDLEGMKIINDTNELLEEMSKIRGYLDSRINCSQIFRKI
jgi:hypothetical protein